MNSLTDNQNQRVYINNVFGKGINGMVGPTSSKGTRYLFAQAKKGGQYFEVGCADMNGQLVSSMGDDNNAVARKILAAIK
jgi:DNA-binding LacI/PurR family transcriptional regulator